MNKEEFPSLGMYYDTSTFIFKNDVQKCCLDKQRVREAIVRCVEHEGQSSRLLEELGLE